MFIEEKLMTERLPEFQVSDATARQKEVLKNILDGPRGNLNGPFLGWIHSPELADHAQRLGAFCRYKTGLPLRLSELAILLTAAQWKSQAEWYIHYPIALSAGVPVGVAEAIRTGQTPDFDNADDKLIYTFVTELYETKRVSDTTYTQALDRFGHTTVVNLVGLLGYYSLVAMTLNVFEMQAEGQSSLPFED